MALEDATQVQPSPLDTDEIPIVVLSPRRRSVWSATWALGGIAVTLAALLAATGLLLLFHYRPAVATAYQDLVHLTEVSRFGFVRVLHRWAAHALLIAVALHLFRVVVAGAYHPPRRSAYHIGGALGLIILFSALTGYLLPWDRQAQWLIRTLVELGLPTGDSILTSAFALHCGVLPTLGGLLLYIHLRRARRDGAE